MREHRIIHDIDEMRAFSKEAGKYKHIGLVPTMGALHAGHISLITKSVSENDLTIVSVFVNPIQFDNQNDFSLYPNTLETDAKAAFDSGADIVFAPDSKHMYPEKFSTFVDMAGPSGRLCGNSRPAHFRGVLTVVTKLFGICMPHKAYFGEKDAQQLALVTKLVSELNIGIEIVSCPIVREQDGLAMSSRNARLSASERKAALCLYKALSEAQALFDSGETRAEILRDELLGVLKAEHLAKIDYAEIVDPITFENRSAALPGDRMMLAVFIGETRLIDNKAL